MFVTTRRNDVIILNSIPEVLAPVSQFQPSPSSRPSRRAALPSSRTLCDGFSSSNRKDQFTRSVHRYPARAVASAPVRGRGARESGRVHRFVDFATFWARTRCAGTPCSCYSACAAAWQDQRRRAATTNSSKSASCTCSSSSQGAPQLRLPTRFSAPPVPSSKRFRPRRWPLAPRPTRSAKCAGSALTFPSALRLFQSAPRPCRPRWPSPWQ